MAPMVEKLRPDPIRQRMPLTTSSWCWDAAPGSTLAGHLPVACPVRTGGFLAQAADLVLLIGFEIAFEPFDVAVAFECQDMRRQAIEEEAVVADDHGAAGEILDRLFESAQG